MARIRTIKPEFFKNEQVAELSPMNRLLFIGLWTQADREGKMEDRPKRLKVEIFPYDDFDMENSLYELQIAGLIIRYQVDFAKFIKIITFCKHQQPNVKEAKSLIPDPENITTQYKHGADTVLASQEGKGRERKGKEQEGMTEREFLSPSLNDVVILFQKKNKGKIDAEKFFNHYEGVGWVIGSTPIIKWEAIAEKWISGTITNNQNGSGQNQRTNKRTGDIAPTNGYVKP